MSSSLRQNRSPPPASCMWPLMAPRSQNQMARSRKSCSSRVKNLETIAFKCTNVHRKENAVTGADLGQEKRPVPSTPVQPHVPVWRHGMAHFLPGKEPRQMGVSVTALWLILESGSWKLTVLALRFIFLSSVFWTKRDALQAGSQLDSSVFWIGRWDSKIQCFQICFSLN